MSHGQSAGNRSRNFHFRPIVRSRRNRLCASPHGSSHALGPFVVIDVASVRTPRYLFWGDSRYEHCAAGRSALPPLEKFERLRHRPLGLSGRSFGSFFSVHPRHSLHKTQCVLVQNSACSQQKLSAFSNTFRPPAAERANVPKRRTANKMQRECERDGPICSHGMMRTLVRKVLDSGPVSQENARHPHVGEGAIKLSSAQSRDLKREGQNHHASYPVVCSHGPRVRHTGGRRGHRIGVTICLRCAGQRSCKKVVGTVTGNITISKCKPKNSQYVSATGATASLETGGAFTWTPSKKTSASDNTTVSSPGQGGCAAGSTEEDATGTITSRSKGNTYTRIGQVISLRVCVDGSGNITLVPGTKAEI